MTGTQTERLTSGLGAVAALVREDVPIMYLDVAFDVELGIQFLLGPGSTLGAQVRAIEDALISRLSDDELRRSGTRSAWAGRCTPLPAPPAPSPARAIR